MSLVGPRPHPKDDVDLYHEDDHRRHLAQPGMTGLWQVSGRSDLDWEESVALDLYYVENWSLTMDFLIFLRTSKAVLSGKGAY
jgi:lipopolysaccharide/colanic/teichoic acid biosynthesis glycosyltransferase